MEILYEFYIGETYLYETYILQQEAVKMVKWLCSFHNIFYKL